MQVVTILSGGMDSAVLLHFLHFMGHEQVTLSFYYGQRHQRELEMAQKLAEGISLEHITMSVPFGNLLGSSCLTNQSKEVPEGHYEAESMKSTVIANRNMIMLSIAASLAIDRKFDAVAFGAHAGDHEIYRDCQDGFVQSFTETVQRGNWDAEDFQVLRPFINMSKGEICKLGLKLNVPFKNTHSCYNGESPACGRCSTCVERLESFEQAGAEDPLEYKDRLFWKQVISKKESI